LFIEVVSAAVVAPRKLSLGTFEHKLRNYALIF
jgi:hypothetical protein